MVNINEKREDLLSSIDNEEKVKMGKNEVREIVQFLTEKYTASDSTVDIRDAIADMGITIDEESDLNGITVAPSKMTTFNVTGEILGYNQSTKVLIRLLGIYLFTNEMMYEVYFEDKTLPAPDEEIVNNFLVLLSIPGLNFDSRISIQDLVRWSIDTGIPLPILRSTLSL